MKYSPARNPHSTSCYAILFELPWPDTVATMHREFPRRKNRIPYVRPVNPIWLTKQ